MKLLDKENIKEIPTAYRQLIINEENLIIRFCIIDGGLPCIGRAIWRNL
jgi:hypothetical protein